MCVWRTHTHKKKVYKGQFFFWEEGLDGKTGVDNQETSLTSTNMEKKTGHIKQVGQKIRKKPV